MLLVVVLHLGGGRRLQVGLGILCVTFLDLNIM